MQSTCFAHMETLQSSQQGGDTKECSYKTSSVSWVDDSAISHCTNGSMPLVVLSQSYLVYIAFGNDSILDYKGISNQSGCCGMSSWKSIHKLYRSNPVTYAKDEREACKHVQSVDRNCLKRLRQIKHEFDAILTPWLHDSAIPLHEQIIDILDRCSGLIITGGHVAILRNRLAFFGLGGITAKLYHGGQTNLRLVCRSNVFDDQIVLFHDSPPWGEGRTEILDTGMGLLPKTVLLPNATEPPAST